MVRQKCEVDRHGFRYRPGDDLEQTPPIIRPTQLENNRGLKRCSRKIQIS
ncbi:MAG: hypothetical protein CM1200mP29_01580 [Verrucomicrobiota bacterium]|nr:MAG: hypothetical protein CM1200mP29_01580 [Verrucomicrobiota bacterium]